MIKGIAAYLISILLFSFVQASHIESKPPAIASRLQFQQIFETKSLMENIISPSRDQLAIVYKSGIELIRLDIHIFNISRNSLISFTNQTIYADSPKKIFWLNSGYFMVISHPENSNYQIIFFKIGRAQSEILPIPQNRIKWTVWSGVSQVDGMDFIYEVKSRIINKYKIKGVNQFQFLSRRNLLILQQQATTEDINWFKFKHLDCYYTSILKQHYTTPYLECQDFSNNNNDSFNLYILKNQMKTALKYIVHPNKFQIYVIFQQDSTIYKINVPIEYNAKDISNKITIIPLKFINENLAILSFEFFQKSLMFVIQISGNQVEPKRCLLFFKEDSDSFLFYQILRIQQQYSSYGGFNTIYKISKSNYLININYESNQFSKVLIIFTNQIKPEKLSNFAIILAISCAFYVVFAIVTIYSYHICYFNKLQLAINWREYNIIIEFCCCVLIYCVTILLVHSTNLEDQKQQNFDYYSNNRIVGSFFSRVLCHVFQFSTLVSIIFQIHQQLDYTDKQFGYHINHGLKKMDYVCYRVMNVYIKAIIHSILSVVLVYLLQKGYCLPGYSVFEPTDLPQIIIFYQISMVSAVMYSILISKAFKSFWLATSVILLMYFQLSNFMQMFYMMDEFQAIEKTLLFIWPQAIYSAYLAVSFSTQLKYLEQNIEIKTLGLVLVFLLYISITMYYFIINFQYSKKDFKKLAKKHSLQANRESRFNTNLSDQQDFFSQIHNQQFLSVFIQCQLSLNRSEKRIVLEDVSFTARKKPEGEILCFIDFGNQSKKALAKILINEQKIDFQVQDNIRGYVRYGSQAKLSYCFDEDIFYRELTIREHLQFYAFLKRQNAAKNQIQSEVQQILDNFNIPEQFSNKKAKHLSGGYLKKMCLACTFIADPNVVILDQPTVGLDLKFQKLFWEKVRLWKKNRIIIIFTTNISEVQYISDQIWCFEKGRLVKYQSLKNKKKKLELSLQFLNRRVLNQASEILKRFKLKASAVQKFYNESLRIQFVLYRFEQQSIRKEIEKLVKTILHNNKQCYNCHLSFKISENIMSLKQWAQYFQNNQSLNQTQRSQLVELLHSFQKQYKNLQYTGFEYEDEQGALIMNKLNKGIKRIKNMALTQIKAVIYRRSSMRKNYRFDLAQTIISQFYFLFHLAYIAVKNNCQQTVSKPNSQFLKKILIYLILHSNTNRFYIKSNNSQYRQYHQSIGLNWSFYWIGNFIYDFCNIFCPIFISVATILSFQFLLSFNLTIDIVELIVSSFILCFGYMLTVIILHQFLRNQVQLSSLLLSFIVYPIYIHQDYYFKLYSDKKDSLFSQIGLFYYPWTVRDWLINQNTWSPYIIIFLQFVTLSLVIFSLEIIRDYVRNKQSHKLFQNYKNQNNKYIDFEKTAIEDCQERQEFILGQNIIKMYAKTECLKNIYFRVKKGELIGFFGHNGCGKTTLFNIIVGKLRQSSGIINYFGNKKNELSNYNRLQMGYCPQKDQFDHDLTLEQNMRVLGKIKGLSDVLTSKFIAVLVNFFSLKGYEQLLTSQLSVNQRKKANIAAAFIGFPRALILDETQTGVEPKSSRKILTFLKLYANQFNNCVLLTSHNIAQAQKFCDRVMIIKNGIIKASGKPTTLINRKQQERYKLQICFIRDELLISNSKTEILQFLKQIQYKIINKDEKYQLGFSFDMYQEDLLKIFIKIWQVYQQGTIYKFSFYKHDFQQVAKFHMSQEVDDSSQSLIASSIRISEIRQGI